VKLDTRRISFEGITCNEEIDPQTLDIQTEVIKFRRPINVTAQVSKVTNAVSVSLALNTAMQAICSRCLGEFEIELKKNLKLNFTVNQTSPVIDLDPEIREEMMLDYPIKPLCSPNCKGLCQKCGKNLNEGGCSCATT